jgi:hypothetical protein
VPCIVHRVPYFLDLVFCIMYPSSCTIFPGSCILCRISFIMYAFHGSYMYYVSCIPSSCSYFPESCVLYRVSFIKYPICLILLSVSRIPHYVPYVLDTLLCTVSCIRHHIPYLPAFYIMYPVACTLSRVSLLYIPLFYPVALFSISYLGIVSSILYPVCPILHTSSFLSWPFILCHVPCNLYPVYSYLYPVSC